VGDVLVFHNVVIQHKVISGTAALQTG
jgi:hypothetical protein